MSEKKKFILIFTIIPALLFLAAVAAFIFGISANTRAQAYEASERTRYSRIYQDLADGIDELEVTLEKLLVSGSKNRNILLLNDLQENSGSCATLLSHLPTSHTSVAELNSFLVRSGDYANSLTKQLLSGKPLADDDKKQLLSLREACVSIRDRLLEDIDKGEIQLSAQSSDKYYEEASKEQGETQELPTLIYDGPFSESAEKAEPRGVSGDEIGQQKAQEIAQKYAIGNAKLNFSNENNGAIPSYEFAGTTDDGRDISVSVTKKGGLLHYMMCSSTCDAEGVPEKDELKKLNSAGQEYLKNAGYENMSATYAQYYGGCALINYAATQDDVILYNDLVKLWIDRKTHEIVGIDARNYLFSHKERSFDEPQVSQEEAETMLSGNLEIKSRELALIPLTPNTEVLCYEFKCKSGGNSYIIYVNTKTGDEEQIFKIIDDEKGTLVI